MGLWWRWCRQIILIVLKLWFEQILISSSFWPKCEKYELMEIWPPMYVPYLVHNKLHGIHIFMWNLFWQLTDSDYQKLPNMKLWTFPIARMTKSEFLKGGKIWFPKRCCEEMQYLLKYLIILTLSKEYLSWSNSVLSWNLSSQRSHAQLRSYFSNEQLNVFTKKRMLIPLWFEGKKRFHENNCTPLRRFVFTTKIERD